MEAQQHFEELLRRFEVPLLQYAKRITGNSERARDVVQEAFIKFQRNGAVAPEKTGTWLFTVCRNGALNVCRKEKRMMYLDEELIESRQDEQPMPFERIERREASRFLMKILATLSLRQQEVLQLKFQNDLSYQQIAEINTEQQRLQAQVTNIQERLRFCPAKGLSAELKNNLQDKLGKFITYLEKVGFQDLDGQVSVCVYSKDDPIQDSRLASASSAVPESFRNWRRYFGSAPLLVYLAAQLKK